MVKLVAADMDGTFLTSNGYFDSKRLHDVLEKFKKNNILFVAASGRSLMALEKCLLSMLIKWHLLLKMGLW